MSSRGTNLLRRFSLSQRFMVTSLVTLVVGMVGIGWWVGRQIEDGVVQRTAATNALYVDSFITPQLEGIDPARPIAAERLANLDQFLQTTPLGQQLVVLKVWSPQGKVLYSSERALIGQSFPIKPWLALALEGTVSAKVSDLDDEENVGERDRFGRLLEMYTPVRQTGTDEIIAVAEFYQRVDELQQDIAAAQRRSWLVVGIATAAMYALLAGFVQRASNTIQRQQVALERHVVQLEEVLGQNQDLHERVQRAAARTTALNERVLRRISADLHDGPAQDLGLALLRLDHVIAWHAAGVSDPETARNLEVIESSLRRALHEIRAISTGLGLPQLSAMTPGEIMRRVVRTHERRTGTQVELATVDLPDEASLPAKITLYRFVQEALTNAFRHAGGVGQAARASFSGGHLCVEVSDRGPGFAGDPIADGEGHLGLVGMRERVESLGGMFTLESAPAHGTLVRARFVAEVGEGLV